MAKQFYAIVQSGEPVVGRGTPSMQNLDQFANTGYQVSRRVTLVTGMPGTGKEAFSNGLHYIETDCSEARKNSFVQITALDLAGDLAANYKTKVVKALVNKHPGIAPRDCTIMIDELNKCDQSVRSGLLRILEQANEAFPPHWSKTTIRFVLAASDHMTELARQPPQDFWTRIDSRIHVVHPTGGVSPQDAQDFLTAFFWLNWYSIAQKWLKDARKESALAKRVLGPLVDGGSPIVERICEEFVDTLVPVCVRDEVSVRALRSIVKQVFSRVIWRAHYGSSAIKEADHWSSERQSLRAVNEAIQEVLSMLNTARNTPRTNQQ